MVLVHPLYYSTFNRVFQIATDIIIMRDGIISLSGKTQDFFNDMLIQALVFASDGG